ncbi:MAG: MBL fold metallo-hydrolase [Acidimicrobiia bacterium]|nr:MBL fold metallo-hydrolase [Acidimicrobiia bacterium]MDX2468557.1 MBL fold metallo-hydrolase [Acidimicrobiia bacterium]
MTTIKRLTDSCLVVTTDDGATLFDPGFHTFESDLIDLNELGDIQRVLVTHEHGDHVSPDFLKWVLDRGDDVTVYGNDAVAAVLSEHDIEVAADIPIGTSAEDVLHETTPMGTAPPNRAWTIDGVITHPGDSYGPTRTAPVLALGLLTPWGSTTKTLEFARKLAPQQAIPVHDFYLSESGRGWINTVAKHVLAKADIEVVTLDWGESFTI